jgi:hypothetical protein
VGEVRDIEVIAGGISVRTGREQRARFGRGRWRKLKGTATVRLRDGTTWQAEVHRYEAHGIGGRRMKIKSFLE